MPKNADFRYLFKKKSKMYHRFFKEFSSYFQTIFERQKKSPPKTTNGGYFFQNKCVNHKNKYLTTTNI